MSSWRHRLLALSTVSALALGAAPAAHASGFQIRENSATSLGSAFAGAASEADDISTIANNPAGMTRLNGNQVGAVASIIIPRAEFSGFARTAAGAPIAGRVDEDAGEAEFVPALYALWSAAPDLRFGLALTAPFGLSTKYSPDWIGRYQAIESSLTTININPNVAYRVTPWLSLAAGASAQYADVKLTNAVRVAPFPDVGAEVKGDGWGFGFNLGALVEPIPGTRIGVTYRSQIHHKVEGDATFSNVPTPLARLFPNSGAFAQVRTPETATISFTQEFGPTFALMADVQWTHWQSFKSLTIFRDSGALLSSRPENWNDTWFGSFGARWRPEGTNWTFRTGVAYDASPVSDEFRTARIPDEDRFWLSFGAGYRIADWLSVDAAYTHIFVSNAQINEPSGAPSNTVLVGSYENAVDLLAFSATLRF